MSNQIKHSGTIEFPSCIHGENIVYYGQSQTLLPGSLFENLYPYVSQRLSNEAFSEVLDKFRINQIMKDHNIGLESSLLSLGNKELSDGQKQRILLARTFLSRSDLILLDEPTSNLDATNSALIIDAIRSYSKTRNIIMTSHNIHERDVRDYFIMLS
jgi:ABC-type transport system involved in cytochrome bd biosynthesis fused ATPase/permease subunit